MNVKIAFLNGDLEEEIYMDQLEEFVAKGQIRKVCKLVKSLYNLKQAPKQWLEKFDTTLTYAGFGIKRLIDVYTIVMVECIGYFVSLCG